MDNPPYLRNRPRPYHRRSTHLTRRDGVAGQLQIAQPGSRSITPWPRVSPAVPQTGRRRIVSMVARSATATRRHGRRRRVHPVLLRPPSRGLAGAVRRDVRGREPRALPGLGPGRPRGPRASASGSSTCPGSRRPSPEIVAEDRARAKAASLEPGAGRPRNGRPPSPESRLGGAESACRGRAAQARMRRLAISPSIWRSAST